MVPCNHGIGVDKEAQVYNPIGTHHLPPTTSTSSLDSESSKNNQNAYAKITHVSHPTANQKSLWVKKAVLMQHAHITT